MGTTTFDIDRKSKERKKQGYKIGREKFYMGSI